MADNFVTNPGTGGATFAADDVGGVLYPRTKQTWGADGVAVDVSAANPLPVTNNDCVTLLSTSISTISVSSSIDTIGYGAVVVQLSGVWQGNCYFEASNDGTNWDTVLVFSRDNLSLQDIITQSGLFTIRPSGRYLHLVVTSVTGTITLNAIGRAAEGISASDLLSLAMERANNTPLHVSLDDLSVAAVKPVQPSQQIAFYDRTGVIPINTQLFTVDTTNFRSLSFQYSVGTTGVMTPQWSNDGSTWFTATTWDVSYNAGTTITAGTGMRVTNCLARFFRLVLTTATTAGSTQVVMFGNPTTLSWSPTTQAMSYTQGALVAGTAAVGDVGIQYRANATGAATTYKFNSAASTNGALVLTGARRLLGWTFTNTTAATKYFKIYNKATAPTVGTDTPLFVIGIPANGVATSKLEGGIAIALGLGVGCTGAAADADATATAVNDVVGAVFYV